MFGEGPVSRVGSLNSSGGHWGAREEFRQAESVVRWRLSKAWSGWRQEADRPYRNLGSRQVGWL